MSSISGLDEAFYGRLLKEIERLEGVLAFGNVADASVRSALELYIQSAKKQVAHFEVIEKEAIEEKKKSGEIALEIAAQKAQMETALNEQERAQFQSFLEQEYFTKADFGKLESFYTKSWDKLTDQGKDEMSHRVWEGVRREEYQFSELPDIVKEKEAERLNQRLLDPRKMTPELQAIPERDRDDFTEAWGRKQREEAYEILDRPTFAENLVVKRTEDKSQFANVTDVQIADKLIANKVEKPASQPSPSAIELMDSNKIKFEELTIIESPMLAAPLSNLKQQAEGNAVKK
ncbi:hypothetical protein FEM03_08075 [Phragmitibacter flavus]|uniref:Uncharacterized protein n=1 Tax=Phragmitibacter flavus TaxID=2576071 RepID=A0A5R8KGN6_9BACT|nr:hypothetical protein [Phragmitibacter flavus]TLD71473.1 hypothetical protein FEM03_08075 [Phragmitibacter flavus]